MPRKGENIYKRKDGRWEGRILNPDGTYKYIYAKSYKEVKEKKKTLGNCLKSPVKKAPVFINSIAGLLEGWLENDISRQVKPTTYESYYRCIHHYVIPFFSRRKEKQFTASAVDDFVGSILNNTALSDSYKRKILSIFKSALKNITKGAAEYAAVLKSMKLPSVRNNEVKVFSTFEQRLVEKAALHDNDRRALGILIGFYSGIRLGELCALKWGDIDFEAQTMSIVKTVSRIKNFKGEEKKTVLHTGLPKSRNAIRKIPLPDFLVRLFENSSNIKNENHYLLSGTNTPIDPRTYQKLYKKILGKAGVKYRKFHAIRHTFATRALELGVDIKTLSEILGHSNVSITLNIYAHSLMEQKKIAIDKLNELHALLMKSASFAVNNSVTRTEGQVFSAFV